MTFAEVVSTYKNDNSLRRFAELLNESLDRPISHGTVKNWLAGAHRPDITVLLRLRNAYPAEDWRHQLALTGMQEYYGVV